MKKVNNELRENTVGKIIARDNVAFVVPRSL